MQNIGKRIKELRIKNNLTQEKLASYLNVSFQTVSKWETGVNMPDLAALVPLAKLLRTTTDILLGNEQPSGETDERRQKLEAAWNAERYGVQDGEKLISAAEALVSAYPDNLVYWCWLAYGERIRAYELHDKESDDMLNRSLKHYIMVIEDCEETYWREEALESAVNILSNLGRQEEALQYAQQLPPGVRRNRVYKRCLPEEERIRHIQKMRASSMLKFLNELLELTFKENLWAAELIITILSNMIPDENYLTYHNYLREAYTWCAKCYTRDGRYNDALTALKNAWKHTQAYDHCNELGSEQAYTAPLMDRLTAHFPTKKFRHADSFLEALQKAWSTPLRDFEDFCRIEAECLAVCSETGH